MITLKQFSPDDKDRMLEILTDPQIKQTYMLPDFEKKADAVPLFERLLQLSRDSQHFVRGIYLDQLVIGFLNDVEIKDVRIEVGYVIHPQFHGKGYMTQALKMAIDALMTLGYRQVITGAFEENTASIRVMQKCNMMLQPYTDEIEYRSKTHRCIYYAISNQE